MTSFATGPIYMLNIAYIKSQSAYTIHIPFKMIDITDDGCASRYAVLQDLFTSKVSLQDASHCRMTVSVLHGTLSLHVHANFPSTMTDLSMC